MTFLPIVGRELRVAARRARAYWGRSGIAAATIIGAAISFLFCLGLPPAQVGRTIFQCLAFILFLYCLSYGRGATADSLSQEKRDGTLGLLFLTDLKGYDVILGKLVATSLRGFYGLLAAFPVLAVPLLMGGIDSGEFWRVVLVLTVTFLYSLAIGMFGSALCRDERRAMAANLNLLLLFVVVPPSIFGAIKYFAPTAPVPTAWLFSCPGYPFYLCQELQYSIYAHDFWWSLGVLHGLTWLLLLGAGWITPRTWQDRPRLNRERGWRQLWRTWRDGPAEGRVPFRVRALDRSPFFWLAARARFKPVHVWTALICIGLWWLIGWTIAGRVWLDPSMSVMTALMLNFTLKVWLAIEAGQELAESRRTGAFELLLTTPLRTKDIIRGQLLALRRQFLWPLVAVLGVEMLLMFSALQRGSYHDTRLTWIAGMVMLAADLVALSWVGMYRALVAKTHNLATIGTTLRLLVLPWFFYGISLAVLGLWFEVALGRAWSPGWKFGVQLWTGVGLGTDLLFAGMAWRQLRFHFHKLALRPYNPAPSRLAQWFAARRAPAPVATPSTKVRPVAPLAPEIHPPGRRWRARRRVRVALGCSLIFLLLWGAWVALRPRPAFPPAVVIHLAQSHSPVRVFPAGHAALLVLPDTSLWYWGAKGPPSRAFMAAPERMGTNVDWVQAAGSYTHLVALRRDGTLWEWGTHLRTGFLPIDPRQEARPVDSARDWTSVSTTLTHSLALKRDGTLWGWGENSMGQLTAGAPPSVTSPIQLDQQRDWTAICCPWNGNLALRRDGTLWGWGQLYVATGSGMSVVTQLRPTQVCAETNWTGFTTTATGVLVRNRKGELWEPFSAAPGPYTAAAACMRLVSSGVNPNRLATGWLGEPMLYELTPNGSIRQRRQPLGFQPNLTVGNWQPLGNRNDWTGLWGAAGAVFGLTRDGTLWTWGPDLGRQVPPNLLTKIRFAGVRLATILGGKPVPPGGMGFSTPIVQEPRPLMQLVRTNTSTL